MILEYERANVDPALLGDAIVDSDVPNVALSIKHDEAAVRVHVLDAAYQADIETVIANLDMSQRSRKEANEAVAAAADAIREQRELARNYADDIKTLFVALIEADVAGDTADGRFMRIRDAVAGAETEFANRFKAALESETGINIDALRILNLSLSQKQDLNAFASRFVTRLGVLLIS